MEEDTSKIWDTTGTVFIQGPSIVLLVWRSIMFNSSYLRACMKLRIVQKIRFPFLSLGGPSHGARVWWLGRVSHILSFRSLGVVSLFIFPTGPTALDSERRGRRYAENTGHDGNRLYSRAMHCPANMEMHYVQWFLLKSVYEITDCAKN